MLTLCRIGNDHIPTYSAEPTSCETKSASFCATTTSFGVSVSNKATVTTATQVLSTCSAILGCNVEDTGSTTTQVGKCTTRTVTDVWVTCAPSGNSCKTTSTSLVKGCDVTATTVSCQPKATGIGGRADGEECQAGVTHVIYPKDGTNRAQTDRIAKKLREFVAESAIYTSNTQAMGINFWLAPLTYSQALELTVVLAPEVSPATFDENDTNTNFSSWRLHIPRTAVTHTTRLQRLPIRKMLLPILSLFLSKKGSPSVNIVSDTILMLPVRPERTYQCIY